MLIPSSRVRQWSTAAVNLLTFEAGSSLLGNDQLRTDLPKILDECSPKTQQKRSDGDGDGPVRHRPSLMLLDSLHYQLLRRNKTSFATGIIRLIPRDPLPVLTDVGGNEGYNVLTILIESNLADDGISILGILL